MEEPRGLNCSVCYNAFTSIEDQSVPRNLNCGHTFCTACLRKIAAQSLHVYVKCPTCKCETPLLTCGHTSSSISSLPKNFGLLEIIECRERKINLNHASTDNPVATNKTKGNDICEEHDEVKKVYCFTDQCLICIYCQIYGTHQGHNCELTSKLAKSSREELKKISEKLENECNKLCKATREVTGMENDILNRQFFLKERVKKYMKLMHQHLTEQEAHIISKIDEMTASKLKVLETQEKTLCEVIGKCKELYLLIQTVQSDGDNGVVEDKPTIEKLVDEMTYLAEACQVTPLVENNLMFKFDTDVLTTFKTISGRITELEADEEQSDSGDNPGQHFLDNALSNLEKELNISNHQSINTNKPVERTEHTETETDDDDDDDDDDEELESTISSSGAEEQDENEEDMNEEENDRTEDEEFTSEGELLGAVGGDTLPEAQQDEKKRKDINEKQSLLRELQHEIERLKLLGPTGELIRVIDDSSSSSLETGTDTDDNEHDTPSLQLDFQIRVNNDLGRSVVCATSGGTSVQGVVPSKTLPTRERRKHNTRRSSGKKRCSVLNCQQHVHPTLQCKNCNRVFCRRCASLSPTCSRSDSGHSYVAYSQGAHHFNKNIKSRKNNISKSQELCERNPSGQAPHWMCKRCTMLNEGLVLVCGACETSKDYDPEGTRNICPMCTLVNEPGKTSCELCDTELEDRE